MANAADRTAIAIENLTDAGLDNDSIAECLKMLEARNYTALERFLASHRKKLLAGVHKYDKMIDCSELC